MTSIARGMNKMGLPLWTTAMPKKHRQPKKSDLTQFIIEKSIPHKEEEHSPLKVVYFPSCINQTMGQSKHGGKIHDLVDEVIQLMAKAGYEVIFPEGTRTTDGHLNEFRPTFAILSMALGIPVVPVCIKGAFEAMPKHSKWPSRLPVAVEYLPPVSPSDFQSETEMANAVRQIIQQHL